MSTEPSQLPFAESEVVDEAAALLCERFGSDQPAELAIVTGSGLGLLAGAGRELVAVPFNEIPGLGEGSVAGHAGRWLLLERGDRRFHCLCGRRHFYEGCGVAPSAHAMQVLARLGVRRVILTNAAGGISPRVRTGDLMLIRDHLNLMFCPPLPRPLCGPLRVVVEYDETLNGQLLAAAQSAGIELKSGIYAAVRGPSYETPAEVRAFRALGADAVGMSTVPEALAASAVGLRVAALSLITNSHLAEGAPPCHDEVLAVARQAGERLRRLLEAFLDSPNQDSPDHA